MNGEILSSEITFFGRPCTLACDTQCNKAFGIELRPTSPNSLDEDDYEWLADGELDEAPETLQGKQKVDMTNLKRFT